MKRHAGVLFLICSLATLAGGCNRSERAKEYHPPSAAETTGARQHGASETAAEKQFPQGEDREAAGAV